MKQQNDDVEMFYGATPQLFAFAKQLRANVTLAENILWERLNKKQIRGLKFRRQHPLKYFIADFYCHSEKLVIELDGGIHQVEENREYDINRSFVLNELGIKVVRLKNEEIFNDIEAVIEIINEITKVKI